MDFTETTISSQTVFSGNVFQVKVDKVKLPDKRESTREIVKHPGGVTMLPLTVDNKIIMVKQYRKAVEEVLLELPAGKLEEKEEPVECVQRELEEETGYRAGSVKKIISFYTSPGYSNEILHLFLGQDLKFTTKNPDKDEFVETEIIEKNQIMNLIFRGKIKDSKTIIGLLYFLRGDFNVK